MKQESERFLKKYELFPYKGIMYVVKEILLNDYRCEVFGSPSEGSFLFTKFKIPNIKKEKQNEDSTE